MNFGRKDPGGRQQNRFCAEVWAKNVDTKSSFRRNFDTERVFSRKPQVSFTEIKFVSRFGLKTSTRNRLLQQNRRSCFRKSELCRSFEPKRLHRTDLGEKRRHEIELPAKHRQRAGFTGQIRRERGFESSARHGRRRGKEPGIGGAPAAGRGGGESADRAPRRLRRLREPAGSLARSLRAGQRACPFNARALTGSIPAAQPSQSRKQKTRAEPGLLLRGRGGGDRTHNPEGERF